MIVISLFTILLRCLMLIEPDNCEKLSSDVDEITDFLQLYKLIKAHQFKNQPKQITNNIYLIPLPLLFPTINEESSRRTLTTVPNKNYDENNKIQAVFRDFEATEIGADKKLSNKSDGVPKFTSTGRGNQFDPVKHKNWDLIPSACGQSSAGDRITGGEDALLGQYPWMARIGFVNMHNNNSAPIFRCGASLITKIHVLTAAHCVTDLPLELKVAVIRLGEYNTDTAPDCVENRCAGNIIDVKPKTITVHDNYGTPTARNDIALIRLRNTIVFTEWISPICLPFGNIMTMDFTQQKGEVAGWGFYDISINKGSTILQTVQLPILKTQPCSKAFRGVQVNYKKQLCVGGDLGKDSCNGDSGGPLMKVVPFNREPKYALLGIVSLGAKYCGLTTAPAIYTKVTYYMEWILDHLK